MGKLQGDPILADLVAADGTTGGFVKDSQTGAGGLAVLDDADVAAVRTTLQITSGTATPATTGVANVTALANSLMQWARIGDRVICSGRIDIDPTTTATLTTFRMAIPIASNFAGGAQCAGVASCQTSSEACSISADTTNDEAFFSFTPVAVVNQVFNYTFMYQVI